MPLCAKSGPAARDLDGDNLSSDFGSLCDEQSNSSNENDDDGGDYDYENWHMCVCICVFVCVCSRRFTLV